MLKESEIKKMLDDRVKTFCFGSSFNDMEIKFAEIRILAIILQVDIKIKENVFEIPDPDK